MAAEYVERDRPGANKAHVAAEDAEQLGQAVDLRVAQGGQAGGDCRVSCVTNRRGAKAVGRENLASKTDVALSNEDQPSENDPQQDRHQPKQRGEDYQCDQREGHVDGTFAVAADRAMPRQHVCLGKSKPRCT